MSYTAEFPIGYIPNPDKFGALAGGDVYFGVPNGSPASVPGDRIQVYLARQGLADLAIAQPIDIGPGGVWYYNGSPAQIKVLVPYCVQILNSLGVQKYYAPAAGDEIAKFNEIDAELATTIKRVDIFTDLASLSGEVGDIVETSAYSSIGDEGGGTFDCVSSTGLANINGVVSINGAIAWVLRGYKYGIKDVNCGGLQNALAVIDDTGSLPVYVKAGKTTISHQDVPGNTSIVGVDHPRQGQPGDWISGNAAFNFGSHIFTSDLSASLFALGVGCQVKNINIWQSNQTIVDNVSTIIAAPPTFNISTVGVQNSDNCVIKNVSALNCYDFMNIGDGTSSVGRTIVEDVFVNAYNRGFYIRSKDGDLPILNRCFVENLFTTTPTYMPNIYTHIRSNGVAFEIGYAQGVNMTDCIALAYGKGLYINNPLAWVNVENFLGDQCALPLHINSCDRVHIANSIFTNNYLAGGPSAKIEGELGDVKITNTTFGDQYISILIGLYSKHTLGNVKLNNCHFENDFPGVLNTGAGSVTMTGCGLDYDQVVGENISIDGGPRLVSGTTLGLTNINPTSPALTGWTYSSPGIIGAVSGGIRIQGAGNSSITYRPSDVSTANLDKLRFNGVQIKVLKFDLRYVAGQNLSRRINMVITNDAGTEVVNIQQICSIDSTQASGFPNNEVVTMRIPLPWHINATKLTFEFNSQDAATIIEITNMDIFSAVIPIGSTGLEWFKWASIKPSSYQDKETGRCVLFHASTPSGGTFVSGDRIISTNLTAGQPKSWIYNGTSWLVESTLA